MTFSCLEIVEWNPPVATLLVDCTKGTYIRALARDLGAALGTGAYLSNLVRLRSRALPPLPGHHHRRADANRAPCWPWVAVHPDIPVQAWPSLILDQDASRRWRQGSPISADRTVSGSIRVYDAAGDWLGTGDVTPDGSAWRPRKVVAEEGDRGVSEPRVKPVPLAADDLPSGERIVTIGTFDGVHRGHRRLLDQAVQRARELDLPVTGVTFEPVPAAVLRPEAFSGRISTSTRSWSNWPRPVSTRSSSSPSPWSSRGGRPRNSWRG